MDLEIRYNFSKLIGSWHLSTGNTKIYLLCSWVALFSARTVSQSFVRT